MFNKLPEKRPDTPLLNRVDMPADLRQLGRHQLSEFAEELRAYLLYCVSQTGGHFSAGLGTIELTIALHYALNTPNDTLIWDVGHQAYPHKILTGRRDAMLSMRQYKGLAPFPSIEESPFDSFGVGHSSTSIGAALGIAIANQLDQNNKQSVAVIGDGAMTAGMAFEALNHAAHTQANLLIILNDNSMSISPNVGGLADYLARHLPSAVRAKTSKVDSDSITTPASIFEDLGLSYLGPCDGHNIDRLINKIHKAKKINGPKIIHVHTQKGHGYAPAVEDPVAYHALNKIAAKTSVTNHVPVSTSAPANKLKYQDVFGRWLCHVAQQDKDIVGITPAMPEGSGMVQYAKQFPERFFDVAIAEQHAVTFAAGLAASGKKPVVAIYSTFLQRAYDQLIHDVALQKLNVTFAVDRAGIVGEDGATHMGNFDLSFLQCIPNMVIACPSDENECYQLLYSALHYPGPAVVRYPRGSGPGNPIEATNSRLACGKARVLHSGEKICVLNFGPLLNRVSDFTLANNYGLCDMRWLKPLDTALLDYLCLQYSAFVTIEENVLSGGAGSAVMDYLNKKSTHFPLLTLGLPDQFIEHGKRDELLSIYGLDSQGIIDSILNWMDYQGLNQ